MDSLLTIIVGVVAGAYFAEEIRNAVPILDPNPTSTTTTATTTSA